MAKHTLAELEAMFPAIKWREPLLVSTAFGMGYDCRVCIANNGRSGNHAPEWLTKEAVERHIERTHA